MTSFLTNIIGNPFSTPVGQLIGNLALVACIHEPALVNYKLCIEEKATDGSEVTENWATYMDICDLINSTEEG